MRGFAESVVFIALAVALHLAFFLRMDSGAPLVAGGSPAVAATMVGASTDVTEMIEAWETEPIVSDITEMHPAEPDQTEVTTEDTTEETRIGEPNNRPEPETPPDPATDMVEPDRPELADAPNDLQLIPDSPTNIPPPETFEVARAPLPTGAASPATPKAATTSTRANEPDPDPNRRPEVDTRPASTVLDKALALPTINDEASIPSLSETTDTRSVTLDQKRPDAPRTRPEPTRDITPPRTLNSTVAPRTPTKMKADPDKAVSPAPAIASLTPDSMVERKPVDPRIDEPDPKAKPAPVYARMPSFRPKHMVRPDHPQAETRQETKRKRDARKRREARKKREARKQREARKKREAKTTKRASRASTSAGGGQAKKASAPGAGGKAKTSSYTKAAIVSAQKAFVSKVRRAVARKKRYPRAEQRKGITGKAAIRVTIDRSGRLVGVSLARSSGNANLDAAAVAAGRNAKYPRIPKEMGKSRVSVTLAMRFKKR